MCHLSVVFSFIQSLPPLPAVTLPISHNHPGALLRLPAFLFLFPLAFILYSPSFFLSFPVLSLLCSFLSSDSSFILVCPSSSLPPSSLPSHHLACAILVFLHPRSPTSPASYPSRLPQASKGPFSAFLLFSSSFLWLLSFALPSSFFVSFLFLFLALLFPLF